MTARWIAPALYLCLFGSTGAGFAQYQQQGPPPPPQGNGQGAYGQNGSGQNGYGNGNQNGYGNGGGQGGWDAPPNEYGQDVQRQGFHDGIRAAREDFQGQQPPNPMHHMEFRHPQVPPPQRNDYREAFRRGYGVAMHHLRDSGGPQGPR